MLIGQSRRHYRRFHVIYTSQALLKNNFNKRITSFLAEDRKLGKRGACLSLLKGVLLL